MATADERETIFRLRHLHGLPPSSIYPLFPDIPKSSLRKIATRVKKKKEAQGEVVVPTAEPRPPVVPPEEPPILNKLVTEYKFGEATTFSKGERIKTLENLINAAEINLDDWEVDHWIANAWEQGQKDSYGKPVILTLWQVKAFLKRNLKTEAINLFDDLSEDLRKLAPKYIIPKWPKASKKKRSEEYMLELAAPDLHFGKFAWEQPTNAGYTMDIAEELFRTSIIGLVNLVGSKNIKQIVLPIGSDLFHVDTPRNETTRGTPQDTDGAIRQHFRRLRIMVRDTVDYLLNIAPVSVVVVPGNHDKYMSFYLGEALSIQYDRTKHVVVDNTPTTRKYYHYGNNFIGFTHGDKPKPDKLPMLMAFEGREMGFADSQFFEWHIGHRHTKKETIYTPIIELEGVRIREIPSLSAPDQWHDDNGYNLSQRAAESFLWDKKGGMVQFNSFNLVN